MGVRRGGRSGGLTKKKKAHNCPCATNPATGDALVHAFLTSKPHIESLMIKASRGESTIVQVYKEGQKAVISKVSK